jgi:hypothetical protein
MEALATATWPLGLTMKTSPTMRGTLLKRQRKSTSNPSKKGWKPRQVELSGGFLKYFNEPSGGLLKGQMSLAGSQLSIVPDDSAGRPHCFQVQKDSERHVHLFSSSSADEMAQWCAAVYCAIQHSSGRRVDRPKASSIPTPASSQQQPPIHGSISNAADPQQQLSQQQQQLQRLQQLEEEQQQQLRQLQVEHQQQQQRESMTPLSPPSTIGANSFSSPRSLYDSRSFSTKPQYQQAGFGSPASTPIPPPSASSTFAGANLSGIDSSISLSAPPAGFGSSSGGGTGTVSGGDVLECSSDPRVNAVLSRYQPQVKARADVAGQEQEQDDEEEDEEEGGGRRRRRRGAADLNTMEIVLRWKGDAKRVKVMNPAVHRSKLSVIWQHEIKVSAFQSSLLHRGSQITVTRVCVLVAGGPWCTWWLGRYVFTPSCAAAEEEAASVRTVGAPRGFGCHSVQGG